MICNCSGLAHAQSPYAPTGTMLLPVAYNGIGFKPHQPWRISAEDQLLTRADMVDKSIEYAVVVGWVLSRENKTSGTPTLCVEWEGNTDGR
jgi:hypothetical protein